MGDGNPIRTLGDYSKPSHEGYRNTIELPVRNNVVPLRSDTIRLVQNGCSFHGLRSEDPNQHLKDFLKLVDSLDLDGENRERTHLLLFQISLRDQASNWLECLQVGSITTWENLTTRFLAQFFPPGRTAKLRNDILMFQQPHRESLSKAWTRFKDLLQKVPHHGIDIWLQIQIFYDCIDDSLKRKINFAAGGQLRRMSAERAWVYMEELAQYEDEGWNDPVNPEDGDLNYENPDIEQLLGIIEHKVDALMNNALRHGTEEKVSTKEQIDGTEDQPKEEIATKASQTSTQTPTSMIFGDDETIATLLINMSKAKAASKEKEKGVELKDVEEIDRPRPTSTRSLLTLKPLPKIDPKDKGKKKIEEEDESESEDDDIPQAVKKFKQLESDEELARKVQEEWEAEEERNRVAEEQAANEALIKDFDEIKARIEADRILAEKLQEQEREQFTIEERAKFLHDTIAAQRKFLAQQRSKQRSEASGSDQPTTDQLRNQMMSYLTHRRKLQAC
ncbi:zinc finger, CCHC-type containing protein [Tanacetum coccineum]